MVMMLLFGDYDTGKRHSKCIGKRIVAGKVIKESYGKEKQQHTFTIQVFWSRGLGKLPLLSLLLVKGRNLYRMMTFRQPWSNEADRSKALEEKHIRGDAARRVRASNRPNFGGNGVLKGKKSVEKGKYQAHPGLLDGESRITKAKKRVMQSSSSDLPNKKSRKEEHPASSGKNRTAGGRKAKTNCTPLDKNIGTSNANSLCNNRETNHVILQKNSHVAPVNSTPHNMELRTSKRKTGSKRKKTVGGSHAQFEEMPVSSASHAQAYDRNLVATHQPFFQRPQRPPPLHEVGNSWQPRTDGRSIACPNPTMTFQHPSASLAGWCPPVYFREPPPDQLRAVFPPFNMSQTIYRPRQEGAHAMPQFRYSGGSNGFPR